MMMKSPVVRLSILAGLVALATASAPLDAQAGDLYTAGHADLNIFYDSSTNTLGMNYEFAANAVINGVVLGAGGAGERPADSITVVVGANGLGVGAATLPAPFAGNPLWTLPQTSRVGRPFLGVGAETIDAGVFKDDLLTLSLTGFAVSSPPGGQFILYQNGAEATPFFNSANGLSSQDALEVFAIGHDHFVWGFTKEGLYDLTFTARGTLTNGTELSTSAVYQFQVGSLTVVPEPGSLTLAGIGIGCVGLIMARRRKRAQAQTATA